MATDPSPTQHDSQPAAEPPSAGRTTQESIRQAAHRPVAGPASSERVASVGGLEIPAGAQGQPFHEHGLHESGASGLIPGARELDNLTHREPGAMSAPFNGPDNPPDQTDLLNDEEKIEIYQEAGGLSRKSATRKVRDDHGKQ